jgi:hypothetical protein
MKYEQTDKSFKYVGSKSRILIKGDICIPFNGETRIPNPDVSWSHGLTHFLNVTTGREHFVV